MNVIQNCSDKKVLFSSEWGRFIYRLSRTHFHQSSLWNDLSSAEWIYRKMSQNQHMQPATWLASRELTSATGPWDTRLSLDDDGEYFCRMILACNGIRFVPGARSYYRMSGLGSLSNVDRTNKKLDSLWLSMQLHVSYLRQLEDTDRTRAACITYLGNWLNYFFPARPDIILQAQQLAQTLGGSIDLPKLSWKYSWIEKTAGRQAANRAQTTLPQLKTSLVRFWDKTMHRFER
jgi:hypothetical protein